MISMVWLGEFRDLFKLRFHFRGFDVEFFMFECFLGTSDLMWFAGYQHRTFPLFVSVSPLYTRHFFLGVCAG